MRMLAVWIRAFDLLGLVSALKAFNVVWRPLILALVSLIRIHRPLVFFAGGWCTCKEH